jgi:hypothetical protein
MRRIAAIGVASFALLAQERAYASDGGTGGVNREKADGGTLNTVLRRTGPPGTFLGALPSTAGRGPQRDADPEKQYPLKTRANGGLFYVAPQFSAEVAPDETVRFHDRRVRYSAPKVTLSFDLFDDFIHDFAHGTLYPYEKANFLAATFKRRTAMAAKWYSGQMRAAAQELPRRLDTLWADTRYRRRERRRIICLLWQDVDTSVAGAPPSAAIIEAWIRKRLPRGSPDAYTDDEVDACSRERVGGPAFRPYGAPLQAGSPSQ